VEEIYKLEKPPSYKEYGTSTNFQQAKIQIQKPIPEQERNDKTQLEEETFIQTKSEQKDETIPKRTPEQLGEIISLRKSISEDVSQHISSVTVVYAPSSQSLCNSIS
jgi:hypothetical protein